MSEYSLDEVYGKGAPAPAGPKEFSLEDVYGPAKNKTDGEIALGGLKAAGKAVAGEAAAVGDMILGMPGAAAGSIAELGLRAGLSKDKGVSTKAAGEAGKDFREMVSGKGSPTWFSDLVNKVAPPDPGEKPDETHVAKAMAWLQGNIDKGGDWVEKTSGGKFTKEDVSMFANGAMNALGLKGTMKGGAALEQSIREKMATAKPEEPTAYTTPEAATKPASRAKEDIERTTGIKDTATADKMRKARRADARKAFEDDKPYADYLNNWVEEDIRQAQLESAREARLKEAEGVVPRSEPSDPIVLREGAKVDDSVVGQRALDTALDKVAKGKRFDLSSEERVALRANGIKTEQLGAVDQKLLAGMAAGATAFALARAYPDEADKGLGIFLGGMIGTEGLRGGEELSSILAKGHNTLLTLERLPQNRVEYPVKMVEEQLRRPDVSKAEKEVFAAALGRHKGENISAAELVQGLRKATGDFALRPKDTPEFSDYGLEAIDRSGPGFDLDVGVYEDSKSMSPEELARQMFYAPVRTRIWKAPEGIDLGTANHFQEAGYFGHTRSFDEDGVKHVVEVQSDLAQKVGKRLTEEEYLQLLRGYDAANRAAIIAREARRISVTAGRNDPVLANKLHEAELRQEELHVKLRAHEETPEDILQIAPMLKNWDRRLIREELADSARKGDEVVRFASADTMAKVEGWPDHHVAIEQYLNARQERVNLLKGDIEALTKLIQKGSVKGTYYEAQQIANPELITSEWAKKERESIKEEIKAEEERIAEDKMRKTQEPRFSPEHQSIYDRYAKDTTKFLKNLGGKEVTDQHGHTWIEVPTGIKMPTGKRAQIFGGTTLDTMKGIAAVSLGLGIGATLDKDNPIEGAVLGVLAGAGLSAGAIPKVYARAKAALKPDTRIRINDLTERQEYQLAAGTRAVWQATQAFVEAVPKKSDREAIHRAIDAGRVASLPAALQKGAKLAQDFYSQMAKVGQEAGVLDEVRTNYTTHLWKNSDAQKLAEIQAKRPGGFATSTRFAKERSHVTLEEGKKAGLIPVTEDLAEVMGIYGNSVVRAAANKNLVNALREAKTPGGEKLILPMSKAPQGYVPIQAGVLNGLRVHPDIAPSLKFVMEGPDPGAAVAALTALNTALKRNNVSFSLFHAKALADAMLGAVNNPLTVGKVIAQAAAPRVFGKNRFLEQLRKGGAGDLPDLALKSGLKFSYERGESSVEDVGGGFYKGMQGVQNMLDQAVPGLGKPVATYARVNHAFDNFMWGRLHSAMKLEVFAAKVEGLMENSAKKGKPLTQEQAGRIAASYTNDIFGGLNWQRIAEGAKTKWGRDVSLAMLSPAGRRGLQLLMFAPDWTLSTARAFTQAFGEGSGVKGLFSASTLADLHRQQLIRSALYYVTIGDAVNYYNTGHHIWDNKDWTRVELGDGRTMQLSKHFAEPFHWMMHPGQQASNKLGTLPKEGIEQAMGVDYLNAKGRMPPMKNRFAHAAKSALPIGVQSGMEQGMGPAISSSLGIPIYGQTDKQKREAAYQARQKRLAEYVKSLEEKK